MTFNLSRTRILFTAVVFLFGSTLSVFAQKPIVKFGKEINTNNPSVKEKKKDASIQWIEVNTPPDTWTLKNGELICSGRPIGVMRSEKQYENFVLHVEWKHMEPGGNSGIFVWAVGVTDGIGATEGGRDGGGRSVNAAVIGSAGRFGLSICKYGFSRGA